MLLLTEKWKQLMEMVHFQYSIGDAYRMIDATEPFIGTFQYSIGDAVTESEALRAMIRFFFQYSIGDA